MTTNELVDEIKKRYRQQQFAVTTIHDLLKANHLEAAILVSDRLVLEIQDFQAFLENMMALPKPEEVKTEAKVEGESTQSTEPQRPSQDSPSS